MQLTSNILLYHYRQSIIGTSHTLQSSQDREAIPRDVQYCVWKGMVLSGELWGRRNFRQGSMQASGKLDSSHQSSHSHLHPSPSCRNCKIGNARSVQGRGLLTKQGVALEAPDPSRQPRRIHRMGTGVPGGRGCARPRERVCLAAPSFRRSSSPSLTYTQTHHRSPSRFTASSGSRPLFPRAELECTHIYRQSSVKQHEQQE